jgi:hypothetical protein
VYAGITISGETLVRILTVPVISLFNKTARLALGATIPPTQRTSGNFSWSKAMADQTGKQMNNKLRLYPHTTWHLVKQGKFDIYLSRLIDLRQFCIFLTMHLRIILVSEQLDVQFLL